MHGPFRRDIVQPIGLAVLFTLVVNVISYTLVAGVVLTLVASTVSVLLGALLGSVLWPRHGGALARRLLASYAKNPERGDLLLTGRAEFPATMRRRVFEAVALIAGLNVLFLIVVRRFVPLPQTVASGVVAFALVVYATVALVPHWTYARLGLRRMDRARFLVHPLTQDYADRLKLSNGAIALIALGVGGFVLRQQGESDLTAAIQILQVSLNVVLLAIVLVISAVAFYQRREHGVVEATAKAAIAVGFRDGRGESHEELVTGWAAKR